MYSFITNYVWSEDIEESISSRINNEKDNLKLDVLVSCWAKQEINKICLEKFEEMSNIEFSEIDKTLTILSELMKLSFDLWRDYDYYTSFTFKSKHQSDIYELGLRNMNYQLVDDQWRSTSKIDTSIVIQNTLNYIICYAIWKQKKRLLSEVCSFCDASLKYSSMCKSCEAPIEDMFPLVERQHSSDELNEDIKDFWICKNCNTHNEFLVNICENCLEIGPHFEKWLCDKCHFINHPYNSVCSVCYDTNIYLKRCHHCQILEINSKFEIICCSCKSKVVGDWMCGDPENHRMYGSKDMACEKCKIDPIKPPNINETKFYCVNANEEIEMWKCTYCKELSEIRLDECQGCLNLRFCDDRILCFYCGNVNTCTLKYCCKCKKNLMTIKKKACNMS